MARWNTSNVTPLQFSRNCPGCARRAVATTAAASCTDAEVVELDPSEGSQSSSPNLASIVFDRAVTVNSFTVSVAGGPPNGNVPGGFTYDSGSFFAQFTANPLIGAGGGGFATATVVIDQGTDCEQTIIWNYTIQAA